MRPAVVRILDFSGGTDFEDSLASTRALIRTVAALGGYTEEGIWAPASPTAHVDLVSSEDPHVLSAALTAPASVIHLASHIHGRGDGEPTFFARGDRELPVATVAHWLADIGQGIRASCLFIDGCNGGTGRFQQALRHCLTGSTVIIASRRMVTESDSAIYSAGFYGAYLERRGKGVDSLQRAEKAANKTTDAFQTITGRPCPFQDVRLTPSRRAAGQLA